MKLSIKNLRTCEYSQKVSEAPEGTEYAFWRIVEHTGAGWFPWPDLYTSQEKAWQAALEAIGINKPNPRIQRTITVKDEWGHVRILGG
ncbi:MAG: hypothetical protein ACYSTI_13010 [Planctomycetota bacterium]|jgi:hypothetical protein